ncbi:HAD family hydrolase [Myceligenerans halotolerans]
MSGLLPPTPGTSQEQAALNYKALLRQDPGAGLSPPLDQQAPHGALDGTLADAEGHIPDVTVAAVRAAVAAGHHVVLASGRSLVGVVPVIRRLGLRAGRVVASNGAVTARIDDGDLVIDDVTAFDPGPVLEHVCATVPEVLLAAEVVGHGYLVSARFDAGLLNGHQRVAKRHSEVWAAPTSRAVVHAPGAVDLAPELRRFDVTVNISTPDWLDLTPQGTSKSRALEGVRRRLLVPPEHTVAVGDGGNDADMILWAARGVAMGHAGEALKAVADDVTGSIDDQGVVPVLRGLVTAPVAGSAGRRAR